MSNQHTHPAAGKRCGTISCVNSAMKGCLFCIFCEHRVIKARVILMREVERCMVGMTRPEQDCLLADLMHLADERHQATAPVPDAIAIAANGGQS